MSSNESSRTATSAEGQNQGDPQEGTSMLRERIGLILGPVLAAVVFVILPDSLPTAGAATAAIAILMAVWWMTEAIPIPATALLPLVLFPLFGVAPIEDVASPYANDIIFLFMGGFVLALAMQRWNLHRRIALRIVSAVGTSPTRLVGGFMLATAFITMWVSNTATAVMMLPIGLSVLTLTNEQGEGKGDTNFATALMLGIAYASSIGSVATLIGTPPNALMAGYLSADHGIDIGFGQWMLVGAPLAAVFLVLAWVVLTKVIFRPKIKEIAGGRELIRTELHKLGSMSRGEKTVAVVFVVAALSWVFIPFLADTETIGGALPWLANISDAGIAMAVAVVLFLIPVEPKRGIAVIDWDSAAKLPWGILLLFGGGLSLSAMFTATGLSEWIGDQVGFLDDVPTWVLVAAVTTVVLLLTELTSNTATAATFLPIMGGVAVGLDLSVMTLVIPTALAATFAFMLPVATPPNAIAFGSGYVKIGQMVRGGGLLNVIGLVLTMIALYTLAPLVFNVTL